MLRISWRRIILLAQHSDFSRFRAGDPINPQLSGSLIAFDFPDCDAVKARNWLWEKHHIECPVNQAAGKHFLRVSCAWFNTRAEIDALAAASTELVKNLRR